MAGDPKPPQRDVLSVPVLDIGALMACATDADVAAMLANDSAMLSALRAAATDWGFFYIANHGVTPEQLVRFQRSMRDFFYLPKATKSCVSRTADNARGYFDDELTKNKTDWKEGFDFAGRQEDGPADDAVYKRIGKDQNQWLDDATLPGFQSTMMQYFDSMEHLSRRILMLFAVALGEHVNFFDQFFHSNGGDASKGAVAKDSNSSFLRLNHYPVAPEPEKTMGVYHHTDAGALTVLLQDDNVASLQVFHRETQEWYLIPPRPDTFVINIGDMVQIWSNDKFMAPLHRVLANGTSERFSAPFFYNPSYDANVQPVIVDANESAKYRPLSWRHFRSQRFAGDYANVGEEIQISHYKINTE
ncbi:2og-fe alamin adenosyltransferase, partial [Globisporangium splendens]